MRLAFGLALILCLMLPALVLMASLKVTPNDWEFWVVALSVGMANLIGYIEGSLRARKL